MIKKYFTVCMLLALAIGARAQDEQSVSAKLVADVSSIEAGKTFRLGVLYKIEPDWHIYWQNPGDAGLPTETDLKLPQGFAAGPIQWPVPERNTLETIVGYGYAGEVLLFANVTAPANLPAGPIELGADTSWLACRLECYPGEAKELKLILEVGPAKSSNDRELFDKYEALVPRPGSKGLILKYDGPASAAPGASVNATVTLTPAAGVKIDEAEFKGDAATLDLFPIFPDGWDMTHASAPKLTDSGAVFTWTFKARPDAMASNDPIRIVARAPLTGGKTGSGEFELPLKIVGGAQATAASPVAKPTEKSGDSVSVEAKTSTGGPVKITANSANATDKLPAAGQPIFSFLTNKRDMDMPFLILLLYAFLGGLILNAMPCVLPVLSLKVMSFVKQAGEESGRIWRLGLMFAVGVVTSFSLLAAVVILLKKADQEVGWGFQMQEPRFVIVMAAVVVALGLSLLGVYEIGLPGSAAGGMDRASRKEGYGGAFFNGVLVTALATPCTAPMLGAALGFAFTQRPVVIFLFFIAIALGLAFPYVLLAANPKLIKWMPKPGAWMNTFKQFMGFLMLATAVWLMWILGGLIGSDGVIVTLAFMLLIGLACWLFGIGHDYSATAKKRRLCTLGAFVLIGGGYWYLPERYIDAFSAVNEHATAQAVSTTGGIQWEPFSIARVEKLVADKRLVFVDFTADWCMTCKVNEAGVLSTDSVRAAFEKYKVTAVRGDWTRRDKNIRSVLSYFGQGGVPLYIVFPPDRPNDYILLSQILTVGQVEDALDKAAK